MSEDPRRQRSSSVPLHLFVFVLVSVLTLANQVWVGGLTIYDASMREKREQAHQVLLENRLPEGETWSGRGANRTNIRVATVWVAEGLRRLTGQPLHRVYFVLDTAGLLAALLLSYWFLRMGGSLGFALGGTLFIGALLPLTYHFHYFHPWDRISLALWVLALILVRKRAFRALMLILPLAVIVKFDIVLLPILFFGVAVTPNNWRRSLGEALSLLTITVATYVLLRIFIPSGFEAHDVFSQLGRNLSLAVELGLRYPPLLAFGLPFGLGLIGLHRCDRFELAAFSFAIFQMGILAVLTNVVEVRAEMPVLVLMLPASLRGLESLIERTNRGAYPHQEIPSQRT